MPRNTSGPGAEHLNASLRDTAPMRIGTPEDIQQWSRMLRNTNVQDVIKPLTSSVAVKGSKGGVIEGGVTEGGGSDGDSGSSKDGSSTGACVSAFVISMFCTLAVIGLFAGIIKAMKVHRRREERDKRRWWAVNKRGGNENKC